MGPRVIVTASLLLFGASGFVFGILTGAGITSGSQTITVGDIDCSGGVDSVDALVLLKDTAHLSNDLPAGCPPIGTAIIRYTASEADVLAEQWLSLELTKHPPAVSPQVGQLAFHLQPNCQTLELNEVTKRWILSCSVTFVIVSARTGEPFELTAPINSIWVDALTGGVEAVLPVGIG